MAQTPAGIQWLTPSSMVGSLVAGASLAIGHDLFYARLNGTAAPADDFSIGGYLTTSKQQFNLNVGNALATLTRTCLTLAIASAFLQSFWMSAVKVQRAEIPKLDALYAASKDFFSFWHVKLWGYAPLVFLLALPAWIVPLLTIFTPGTLSVNFQPQEPSVVQDLMVPNLDFRSLVFAQDMPLNDDGKYVYRGPSQRVLKVAETVVNGNTTLPVSPPMSNSTWTVNFSGPDMHCKEIAGDDKVPVLTNIAEWTKSHCQQPSGYLSWLQKRPGEQIELPYVLDPPDQVGFDAGASSLYDDDANLSLYVATVPMLLGFRTADEVERACSNWTSQTSPSSPLGSFGHTSLVRCDLVNATYGVAFEFIEGLQDVSISVTQASDVGVVKAVTSVSQRTQPGSVCMQIGSTDLGPGACTFDEFILRRIAYQSIFVAFDSLVKGRVTLNEDMSLDTATGVTLTALANTSDLAYLTNLPSAYSGLTLQSALDAADTDESRGLSHTFGQLPGTGSRPLKEAIQELFRNITVSMMSSSDLLPSMSSATALKNVSVTFTSWQPTYIYARGRLWLFNGIAIGLATLSTVVGLGIILYHKVAHDDKLSALLKLCAQFSHNMSVPMLHADQGNPLLEHEEEAQVNIFGGHHAHGEIRRDSDDDIEMENIRAGGRLMRAGV